MNRSKNACRSDADPPLGGPIPEARLVYCARTAGRNPLWHEADVIVNRFTQEDLQIKDGT